MAKKIRFPLKLNGTDVYNIEELRDNYNIDAIIDYYKSGQLLSWLKDRYYYDEAEIIERLSADDGQLQNKIARALGAENEANNDVIEQNKVSLSQSVNSVILPSDSDKNRCDKNAYKEIDAESDSESLETNLLSSDSNNLNEKINDQSQKTFLHEDRTDEIQLFSSNASDLDSIANSINSTSDSSNVVSQITVNDDNNISDTQYVIKPTYVSNSSQNNSESIHSNVASLTTEPTISNSVVKNEYHQNDMPAQTQITPPTTKTESTVSPKTIFGKIGFVVRILFLLFFLFMSLVSFTEGPVCGLIALLGAFIMCPVGLKKVRDKVPVWVQIILSFILLIVSISMYTDTSSKTSENSDLNAADSSVQKM